MAADLHPNYRLWIFSESNEGVFGDGKARLLREIERTGSLSAAAAALNISYRKSWDDLKKAEACMGVALIAKTRGGKGGGHTVLTDDGRKLLAAYDRFRKSMTRNLEREFRKFLGELAP